MCQIAIFLFLIVLSGPVWAKPLVSGGAGRAVEIVDGDTLILDDGREVRLVGIQTPKLPLGRRNFRAWPLADAAKAALTALALNKTLKLSYGGRRVDRYNRLLAHLHDENGVWVQGEMLRRGMARVYSFKDNRALVGEMLALEHEARAEQRGIWHHPFYRIREANAAARDIGGFHLVEGRVLAVAARRKWTYLNFSEDWRTDFTIAVPARARRSFRALGFDLKGLEGKMVRVRGWIKSRNGPMIEASHPEQIEVLQ